MTSLFSALPHSAFVHMPLALAMLWPVAYGLTWWSTSRKKMPDRLWYGVLGLALLEVGASLSGILSGEVAKVASGANADLLHHHEELAEVFMGVWWVLLILIFIAWRFRRSPSAQWLHGLTLTGLIAQAGLALAVGHAGGALLG